MGLTGMALRNRFQQTLTRALSEAGFQSVAEAAREAGIPYATLQKAVSGVVVPTPATIRKLARRLELDANRLVRSALEARALEHRPDRQELDREWELVRARAGELSPEVERALLDRIDWFLRGAGTRHLTDQQRRRKQG